MNIRSGIARNTASKAQLLELLKACDLDFSPPLSERQDIPTYAERIFDRAERFEFWRQDNLEGLVAMYCKTPPDEPAFITNVSVNSKYRGQGIADTLLNAAIAHARTCGFSRVALDVDEGATAARCLYRKHKFVERVVEGTTLRLQLAL